MKIFIFRSFLLVTALSTVGLYAKESGPSIRCTKEHVFEMFFRELLENTPAGYVLCGRKPLYLESFLEPEKTIPGSKSHRFSSMALLFLEYWKEIVSFKSDAECVLAVKENEFLIINRKEFLKTVKEHLSLFQYKLGIETSPEGLLEALLNPQNNFHSLFQKNISLQGILLGYGAANSISYEKGCLLMKDLHSPAIYFPYQAAPSPKTELQMLQKLEASPEIKKNWGKLKEEMKNFVVYRPIDKKDRLKIPFSFHAKRSESERLLAEYRIDQKNVESLLFDKNFLKKILAKLGITLKASSIKQDDFFSAEEKLALPNLVAASLRNTFKEEWSSSFIQGMKAVESDGLVPIQNEQIKFFEIHKNQNKSNIECVPFCNSYCIIPNKLYFQIIKEGHSFNALSRAHKKIKVHYSIKNLAEDNLYRARLGFVHLQGSQNGPANAQNLSERGILDGSAEWDLKNLIPGLSHGMLGMAEGEIRDILIHPDFAYGIDCDFFDRKPLHVRVELLEISDVFEENDLLMFKLPYPYAPNISSCLDFLNLQNEYFYYCGASSWAHYKKAFPLVSFDRISPLLENLSPLSAKEKKLLLKLEWFLYSIN